MKPKTSDSTFQQKDHPSVDKEKKGDTPFKYAGPKFHTTSPSPKTLPIPVFLQNQEHGTKSLSTSLPTSSISLETKNSEASNSFPSNEGKFKSKNVHSSNRSKKTLVHPTIFDSATDTNADTSRHRRRTRASTVPRIDDTKPASRYRPTTSGHQISTSKEDHIGNITILQRGMTLDDVKEQNQTNKPKTPKKKKRSTKSHDHSRRVSDPGASLHSMSCDLKQILRIVDAPAF